MDTNLFVKLLNAAGILFQEFTYTKRIKDAHAEQEKTIQDAKDKIAKKDFEVRDSNIGGMLVPGIIVGCISLGLIIGGLSTIWPDDDTWISLLCVGLALSIPATILLTFAIRKRMRNLQMEAELAALKRAFKEENIIEEYSRKIKSLNEQKRAYQQVKLNATTFLPVSCRTLYAVCYLLVAVANGRCETLNEGVTLLETERADFSNLDPEYVKEIQLENINSALYLVKTNKDKLTIKTDQIEELEYFDT